MNDFRFDNLLRYAGESAGYPGVGDFAGDLTTTATAFSLVNDGLNLTFGTYPRASAAGPAGPASSYQHRLYSWLVFNKNGRDSRFAKVFFRLSDDEQKMLEASWFAAALIGALFFSILFIFLLVMRISNSV